eukprot:COSAG01_NODE_14406_length_1458_cov_3.033848_1_plen_141_part_10
MPSPAAEEESSSSEQGAEEFADAPSPEPAPEGPPWWQVTIDDLGRGVVAEAGVIQAALQLQSQAVAAAAQERADRREELRERREAEREEREQRRFDALEAARVRDAEKLHVAPPHPAVLAHVSRGASRFSCARPARGGAHV